MVKKEEKNEISIELSDEIAQGSYSNLAVITHSSTEFIIDFVRVMPGMKNAPVKSRVILCAEHAKRLLYALGDNIRQFEEQFGEIDIDKDMQTAKIPLNFGTKPTMA